MLAQARSFLQQIAQKTPHTSFVDFCPDFRPRIALVTLCNQPKMNSMSVHMILQLSSIMDKLEESIKNNEGPDALILAGYENNFCAGFDVSNPHMLTSAAGSMMSIVMQDSLHRLFNAPLVSVAAVDGYALGGGAELTSGCDFRVVSSRAHVQFVHRRMGVTPGWGGAYRLIDIVGRSETLKVLGGLKKYDPETGMKSGYFDAVFPADGGAKYPADVAKPEDVRQRVNPIVFNACDYLEQFLGHPASESSSATPRHPLGLTSIQDIKKSIINVGREQDYEKIAEETRILFEKTFESDKNAAAINAHQNRKSKI